MNLKDLQLEYWKKFEKAALEKGVSLEGYKPVKTAGIDIAICKDYHLYISSDSRKKVLTIKLYIGNSKEYFKFFENKKLEIEEEIGSLLEWKNLESNKSSMIMKTTEFNIYDRDSWDDSINYLLLEIPKFINTFKKHEYSI